MFDDKNHPPQHDDLEQQLQGLGKKISAPPRLKEAVKSGTPMRRGRRQDTVTTHVKRFSKAVLAYVGGVILLLCCVIFLPRLMEGGAPTGTERPVGASTTDHSRREDSVANSENNDPDWSDNEPYLSGDGGNDLEALLAGKTNLTKAGKLDFDSLRTENFTSWNEQEENIAQLFDGIIPAPHDTGYLGICGGVLNEEGSFYFSLTEKARVSAYVITTSNCIEDFPGRNPEEWTLYATNDLSLPLDQWTVLDYVYEGNMVERDSEAHGYQVDAAQQGEYQHYCWRVTAVFMNSIQLSEFELYAS